MSKKVNKRKKVFQIYGINNCLPILNSSNYNIVDIFLSDDSNTDVNKIFSLKKAEQSGLKGISSLPKSLKILLENLLRFEDNLIV